MEDTLPTRCCHLLHGKTETLRPCHVRVGNRLNTDGPAHMRKGSGGEKNKDSPCGTTWKDYQGLLPSGSSQGQDRVYDVQFPTTHKHTNIFADLLKPMAA